MITIEKDFSFDETYPTERVGAPGEVLFFDIETTGLSARTDSIYLIGAVWKEEGNYKYIQWFADTAECEPDLLHAFFSFLKRFRVGVHFNGDGFDLPFLRRRSAHYGFSYDFEGIESVDIYKRIRPYRDFLSLPDCRQKSVERFLKIDREDRFSGGELTAVYREYLRTKDPSLRNLLLLHNADDLKGMPKILPILSYPDLFRSPLVLTDHDITGEEEKTPCLTLNCVSDVAVPVPVCCRARPVTCFLEGDRVTFQVELLRGTLKHYFENPKDYYYLIYEDMAVHKSVGSYVAKEARKKATPDTCYVKQEGTFVPQFSAIWEPVMKTDRSGKMLYAPLSEVSFDDPSQCGAYLGQLLHRLVPSS